MYKEIDVYFLIGNRLKDTVHSFISEYIPRNIESSADYPIPQHSEEPLTIYDNVDDLLVHLQSNENEDYAIYWNATETNALIRNAMVFYTEDSHMIFGLTFAIQDDSGKSGIMVLINEISAIFRAIDFYITSEEPPPFNAAEFLVCSKERGKDISWW